MSCGRVGLGGWWLVWVGLWPAVAGAVDDVPLRPGVTMQVVSGRPLHAALTALEWYYGLPMCYEDCPEFSDPARLVESAPGSGCFTPRSRLFTYTLAAGLPPDRAVANLLAAYNGVDGQVTYGAMPAPGLAQGWFVYPQRWLRSKREDWVTYNGFLTTPLGLDSATYDATPFVSSFLRTLRDRRPAYDLEISMWAPKRWQVPKGTLGPPDSPAAVFSAVAAASGGPGARTWFFLRSPPCGRLVRLAVLNFRTIGRADPRDDNYLIVECARHMVTTARLLETVYPCAFGVEEGGPENRHVLCTPDRAPYIPAGSRIELRCASGAAPDEVAALLVKAELTKSPEYGAERLGANRLALVPKRCTRELTRENCMLPFDELMQPCSSLSLREIETPQTQGSVRAVLTALCQAIGAERKIPCDLALKSPAADTVVALPKARGRFMDLLAACLDALPTRHGYQILFDPRTQRYTLEVYVIAPITAFPPDFR